MFQQQHRTDDILIQSCRKGEAKAWEEIVDRYERLVYSIPLNYGLSRDDAADIAQVTFTILLQSLDNLRPDSQLGAWLATVARRRTWRLLERHRRESIEPEEDLADSRILIDNSDAVDRERMELLEWINQGLTHISQRCRDLLTALYFAAETPSYNEIAERFQMRVGSVGPTRARCLERLKEHMVDNTEHISTYD